MGEQLNRFLKNFTNWEDLPKQAELHGMSSLLWHHIQRLQIAIPPETKRTLHGLSLRQRAMFQEHVQVLLEITKRFEQANIRALVLKGLALAHQYYPNPKLRHTGDIDLLLKQDDILSALDVLTSAGYKPQTPHTDFKRLPKEITFTPLQHTGLVIHIELHHYDPQGKSAVDNSPDDEFIGFDAEPHTIKINHQEVYVPNPINHLDYIIRHLTRHLFVATDSNPLPLKWIVDIINLVEHHAEEINWQKNSALLHRLEMIYSLTPLPEHLANVIPIQKIQIPKGLNQYPQGWPQQVYPEWKQKGFWYYLKNTFVSPKYIWATLSTPSEWWLMLQYGIPKEKIFWYGQVVYRLQVVKMAISKIFRRDN
jgi:hypothetical protein